MKFEEFKTLIKTRKEIKTKAEVLIEKYNQDDSKETLEEYSELMREVKTVESKISAKSNDANTFEGKLRNAFTISAENFEDGIQQYFQDYIGCLISKDGRFKSLHIAGTEYKLYYNKNVCLEDLYNNTESDLSKLIKDYPQIEGVLWSLVKSKLSATNNKESDRLIKKLIDINNKINVLSDPDKVNKELEKLYKEKAECKTEYEKVAKAKEEITF